MFKRMKCFIFVEFFQVQSSLLAGDTCFTWLNSHEVDPIIINILKNIGPREIAEHDISPAASRYLSQVLKLDFDQ